MRSRFRQFTFYLLVALTFSVVKPVIAQVSYLTTGVWTTSCTGRLMRLPIDVEPASGEFEATCAVCVLCAAPADAALITIGWLANQPATAGTLIVPQTPVRLTTARHYFQARAP